MGIRDLFASLRAQTPEYLNITYVDDSTRGILGMSVEDLYRTQPYLRTLVSFLARNIAQLGLHSFERVTDVDRKRLTDDPIALLLKRPNATMTTYDLIYSLVADKALYDEAIWVLGEDDSPSGWFIQPVSPSWVTKRGGGSVFAPEWIEFSAPGSYKPTRVQMSDLIWFHGWNPGSPATASSPVDALKMILAEQIHAQRYREQVWRRGGRHSGFLTRPAGAKWDKTARERFQRQWQAKYAGDEGAQAGGTPLLEDGMEYKRTSFTAREEEFVEGSKLALATVATVYHVNPTMVGLIDNANFSNVREFRKMLYGDTLGSTISEIEDRLNAFLVPRVAKVPSAYVEFNIEEKLQGNFEEQSAAIQSAVGAPIMTRNEGRALRNLPALPGGDALVTPLNVLIGGQASAQDSGSQNIGKGRKDLGQLPAVKARSVKADAPDPYVEKTTEVLRDFFKRQRAAVLARLGAKTPEWWDEKRWDTELSDDLYALAVTTTTELGMAQASELGFDPDEYDADRTLKFLRAVADSRAGAVNSTTRDRIKAALEEEDGDPAAVFDEAEETRSGSGATALVVALAGFALMETATQLIGSTASKTWVTGANARPDHAQMDGETVGIEEVFSNGANWPGDPVLGAEGVSNCNCSIEISF